jgi:peptidoglycan/LPS O-acetylase OafA/YrhL
MPQPESSESKREAVAAPERRVFHTLDALRGIAAIGVVAYHMYGSFTPIAFPGGYLAVDIFFMMSGLVLSHAYEARFQRGMGTLDFMRVRLIRLYPLYLLGTLFGIVLTLASFFGRNVHHWDPSSLSRAVMFAVFLLPNVSTTPVNYMFPLNIPCWSLFLEILVNLMFVIFWPWLTSRRLSVVCLLTGGAVGLAIAHQGDINQGATVSSLALGLARTVFGFGVGVLIARRIRAIHRAENNLGVLGLVTIVGIAIMGWPTGELRAIWDAVCVLVAFPLIVYCGTLIEPGPRLRIVATLLGVVSYAIYVLHSPLFDPLTSAARIWGVGAPYSGLGALVILLLGCWMIDRYFDMPIRRRLSRIIPKTRAVRAVSDNI